MDTEKQHGITEDDIRHLAEKWTKSDDGSPVAFMARQALRLLDTLAQVREELGQLKEESSKALRAYKEAMGAYDLAREQARAHAREAWEVAHAQSEIARAYMRKSEEREAALKEAKAELARIKNPASPVNGEGQPRAIQGRHR